MIHCVDCGNELSESEIKECKIRCYVCHDKLKVKALSAARLAAAIKKEVN